MMDASLFCKYSPCSENYKVKIAEGSLSIVTAIGSIIISKILVLGSVLLVPNLTCNLLFISKLTKDMNCVTKFFPTHCKFQDLNSGRMIGNAKESEGLYLLKSDNQLEEQSQSAHFAIVSQSAEDLNLVSISNNESVVILWHFRLGHPTFIILKSCFLHYSLIKIQSLSSVKSVSCPNIHKILIPFNHTKHHILFSIIYSDIWKPF